MPTVAATWCAGGLIEYANRLAGVSGSLGQLTSFKVGEGGFKVEALGNVPRMPDPTLTDLDILENPSRYTVSPLPTFQKALGGGDFVVGTTGQGATVTVTCTLDAGEYNDDDPPNNNFPQIYEIGLFAGSVMVAYGTFAEQLKNGVEIIFTVVLNAEAGG